MLAALAWYGYVASVAAAIVLLGGAIQYAYGGSRFGLGLIGRSRQRRRLKRHALPRERRTGRPDKDQIRLLNAVYEHFRSEGNLPRFDYIVWMLDKEEIEAREAAETMPTGLLTPDPQPVGCQNSVRARRNQPFTGRTLFLAPHRHLPTRVLGRSCRR